MSTRTLSMRSIRELYRLKFEAGLSHQQIARALQISKGVVAKYVRLAEAAGLGPTELLALSEDALLARLRPSRPAPVRHVPPDYAAVHQELKRKGVTLTLLWEEYVAAHPGASTYRYSQFAQRYRDFAARLRRSMRQVHRAGEKLFVDYAGQTVPYGEAGERAQIFVATLGASSYTFACASPRQTLGDWVGALVRAFEYLGGVPELVVPDNARALIADPDRYAPQYGGYCAWAVSQGYTASADPKVWKIVDGRLYLNYNAEVGRTWEKDVPGNIAKANANWPKVLG